MLWIALYCIGVCALHLRHCLAAWLAPLLFSYAPKPYAYKHSAAHTSSYIYYDGRYCRTDGEQRDCVNTNCGFLSIAVIAALK